LRTRCRGGEGRRRPDRGARERFSGLRSRPGRSHPPAGLARRVQRRRWARRGGRKPERRPIGA